MSKPFQVGQGNTPKLVNALTLDGAVFVVTGMTVEFILQGEGGVNFTRTGAVEDGPAGKVNYQFIAADTAAPGNYLAQWRITDGAVVRTFPETDYVRFTVNPGLPFVPPTGLSRLSEFYGDVRALTGDHKARRYEDSALEKLLQVTLRGGRVPGYALGTDRRSITPAIPDSDPTAYLLLVYHVAKLLLMPNVKASGYRTRAVSERFGDQKDFLVELENVLFELENGNQTYSTITGVRSYLEVPGILIPLNQLYPETIYL